MAGRKNSKNVNRDQAMSTDSTTNAPRTGEEARAKAATSESQIDPSFKVIGQARTGSSNVTGQARAKDGEVRGNVKLDPKSK